MTDEEKIEEISKEEADSKLEEYRKMKEEYLAGWQRARADFLNYKKEEGERLGEIVKYANEDLVMEFLPIADNLDLLEKHLHDELRENDYVKGILLIRGQIKDFLKNHGVEEIKTIGEKFNPTFHEVVGEVSPSEASAKEDENIESEVIAEEIQKGKTL